MRSRICAPLCVALLLAACGKETPQAERVRPAVVVTVGAGAMAGPTLYPGEVRSRYEADLAFRVGGKLVERRVNPGDRVRKGQLLARLDPTDVALSAQSAAAQLAAAQADLALARAEYERAQTLVEKKFLSASVLDARRSQFEAAQARVAQARASHGVSDNQLAYTRLTADRDGVVTALPVEVGQVVAAGQLVARLADPAEREVLIWIPEGRERTLQVGQPAMVRAWSAPGRNYRGVLREIAASADATTRTYAARIRIEDADAALGLGASAGAGFVADARPAGLTLPLGAVVRGEGDHAQVWVVGEDARVSARAITVVAWRDAEVIVGSGLATGERVVSVGAHALVAGEKVRPVEQGAPVVMDVRR
ncbi:MAG: efflux RND transporter periplasmic adaptor subunit [Candidatus Dactylopiibacterium sp.]|nr:efflux RND transporter periplasmic adaptor subunit [Candidatus Dactylopiibacterium sp.]